MFQTPIQHESLVSTVASAPVEEARHAQPVYVYRQEEVKIPRPQAEVRPLVIGF